MARSYALLALALVTASCSTAPPATDPPPLAELSALRPLIDQTGYAGTVVVMDVRRGSMRAVYSERAGRRLIPASTYKVLNSLIALETGAILSDTSTIFWDGTMRERIELNRDLDLRTAFQLSAVPHYQALAREIGQERMQRFVDATGYGNRDISGGIENFWLSGGLRISPKEQVEFLTKLYRNELPFSERTMETVRRIMVVEETGEYTLRAKTGWAILPEGHVGWWVGWVERGDEAYVFSTALETDRPGDSFAEARLDVTRAVLRELGILPAPAARAPS